jgi:alpha-ribazole phosphatase/probable phosphoglycerate mutase
MANGETINDKRETSNMLKVILLRHGETPYNADGNRYCGRTDIGLTEKGILQAQKVFTALKNLPIDAVYASPLVRACKTAEIASGNGPVITDARIIEADFGLWEGKTKEEFIAENPELWQQWMKDPQNTKAGGTGETGGEIVKRVNDFFEEMNVKHNNQTIMVVAHNGINRLYMASKLGMPLSYYRRIEQENSSITLFELDDENVFTLKKLNAT